MYEAIQLEQVIEQLIEQKTGIRECTFNQIDKNLTIIATNLNLQKPYYLNRHNTPDLAISRAIRMSIAYPVMITPVLYQGDLFGDGGEAISYPITIFDQELDETIGITIASHNENKDYHLTKRRFQRFGLFLNKWTNLK